jgi:hypothetical protein
MNTPDQFRATQFIKEMEGGAAAVRLHPPAQRPHGRGTARRRLSVLESFVADNDYALGASSSIFPAGRNGARRQSW